MKKDTNNHNTFAGDIPVVPIPGIRTDMIKNIIRFLSLTVFTTWVSCSAPVNENANSTKIESDRSPDKNQFTDSISGYKNQVSDNLLATRYIKAIQDFIDAIHQKDKISFDTLFVVNRKQGLPDDFPDIELPEKMDGVEIVLLPFEDAHGGKKRQYSKTSPLINLMGWVDTGKAEFIFVTFFPEFKHQYDCHIHYKYNPATSAYDLEKLTIEVLVYDMDGKPDHFAVYQDNKHVGDNPVK